MYIIAESRHTILHTNNPYLFLVRSFVHIWIFLKNQQISHMNFEVRPEQVCLLKWNMNSSICELMYTIKWSFVSVFSFVMMHFPLHQIYDLLICQQFIIASYIYWIHNLIKFSMCKIRLPTFQDCIVKIFKHIWKKTELYSVIERPSLSFLS